MPAHSPDKLPCHFVGDCHFCFRMIYWSGGEQSMNEIGSVIRKLRLKYKMTQAQLASKLDVQSQTVSKWETGTTLPDTQMLPIIAEQFGVSIDELFGRTTGCGSYEIPNDSRDFLLRTYSQMYGPEAGPWNLSVENKYLEYRIADFFEKNFTITDNAKLCNIGIGAGEWDLYLSYKLRNGTLTSIDKFELCCRQLEQRLKCEANPNDVTVICADALDLNLEGQFDVVTMVGSTVRESGIGYALLEKAMGFVKEGGFLYYQSIDDEEDCNSVIRAAYQCGMNLAAYCQDDNYGYTCHYYKFERA